MEHRARHSPAAACAVSGEEPDQPIRKSNADADRRRKHSRVGHCAQEESTGKNEQQSTRQRQGDYGIAPVADCGTWRVRRLGDGWFPYRGTGFATRAARLRGLQCIETLLECPHN
jgi:hypothetical protein